MAIQMLANPDGTTAKVLPFWSTRELGTYAINGTGSEYLIRGLTHFGVTWLLLAGGAALVTFYRLRLIRLPAPSSSREDPRSAVERNPAFATGDDGEGRDQNPSFCGRSVEP